MSKKPNNKCFSKGIVDSEMAILTKHMKNKEVTRKSQNMQLSKVDVINHNITSDKRIKYKRKQEKMDTGTAENTISGDNIKLNASIHKKENNECSENIGISIDDCNVLSVSKRKKHEKKQTKEASEPTKCIAYKNKDNDMCKLVKKDIHNDICIVNQDNNPCEVKHKTHKKKHKNTTEEQEECIILNDEKLDGFKHKKVTNESLLEDMCISKNMSDVTKHKTNMELQKFQASKICTIDDVSIKRKKQKYRDTEKEEKRTINDDNEKLNASKHNKKPNSNECISEHTDISESMFVLTKHKDVNSYLQTSKVGTIDDISCDKKKKNKKKHKNGDKEKGKSLNNNKSYSNSKDDTIYKECVTVVDGREFSYIVSKKKTHFKKSDCVILTDDGKSSFINCSEINKNEEFAINAENVSADNDSSDGKRKHKKKHRKTDAEKYITDRELNAINLEKSVKHNNKNGHKKYSDECVDNLLFNKKQKHLIESDCIIVMDDGKSSHINCSKINKNEEFTINSEKFSSDNASSGERKKHKKKHRKTDAENVFVDNDSSGERKKHKKKHGKTDAEKYITDGELNAINLERSVKHNKNGHKKYGDECVDNFLFNKKQKHLKESDCIIVMDDDKSSHINCSKINKNEEFTINSEKISSDNASSSERKKHKKKHRKTDAEKYITDGELNAINLEKSVKHNKNRHRKSVDECVDNFLIDKKQKHLKESDCIILMDDGKGSHVNCSKININEENVSVDNDSSYKRKKHKKKHRKTNAEKFTTDRVLNAINLVKSAKHNDKNGSRKSGDECVDNFLINNKQKHLKESDCIILTDDDKSSHINCSNINKNYEEFAISEENVSAGNGLGDSRKIHYKKHKKTHSEKYIADRELNAKTLENIDKNQSRKSVDGCVDNLVLLHNSENEIVESVVDMNNVSEKRKRSVQEKRKRSDVSVETLNNSKHIRVDYTESKNEYNCESLQEVAITVSNKESKKISNSKSFKHNMGVENIVDLPLIDFPISPLHENGQVRCLSAEEKNKLISMGIKIQTGRFTKKEDTILLQNWQDFVKKVGIDDPIMLLGIGQGLGRKSWKPSKMYLHLTRGLENRTLHSIYQRARDLFHPNKKHGQLTDKNILDIKKLKLKHGNNWETIGKLVGIPARTCATSYRGCSKQVSQGKFTEEEDQILIKAVNKVKENQGKKLTGTSVDTEGIPWETVASLVPTRNVFQCRQRWILYLSWNLCPEKRRKWSKQDMAKVICLLKKNIVEDETLIDWKELNNNFFTDCSPSHLYIMKKWYHVKYTIPKSENVNHASRVNYLYSTYVPKVFKSLRLQEEHLFVPNADFVKDELDD